MIPSSALKRNIGKTLIILNHEGTYPSFGLPWRRVALDNFTDTLMLNTGYSVDSKSPFKSALVNLRQDGVINNTDQVSNLQKLYSGKPVMKVGYERYWHGYLVFLRPLLVFFSYSSIRWINTLLLIIGLVVFSFLSWKKLGKKVTISFIVGLFAVDFFYLGQSMQFSSVFLLGLAGSIYLLYTYKRNQNLLTLFFIIGGLTSFFDLLTAPLVTLGMLLVIATNLDKRNLKNIILNCLAWSTGYLLLWYSKWAIVQYLYTPGAIMTAYNEILNRTGHQVDANFSHLNAVRLNLYQLRGYDKSDKVAELLAAVLYLIIFLKYLSVSKEKLKKIGPLILIAAIPYLWYYIAANHSYIHVWFTYRDQFMSVACVAIIALELVDWNRLFLDYRSLRNKVIPFEKPTPKRH